MPRLPRRRQAATAPRSGPAPMSARRLSGSVRPRLPPAHHPQPMTQSGRAASIPATSSAFRLTAASPAMSSRLRSDFAHRHPRLRHEGSAAVAAWRRRHGAAPRQWRPDGGCRHGREDYREPPRQAVAASRRDLVITPAKTRLARFRPPHAPSPRSFRIPAPRRGRRRLRSVETAASRPRRGSVRLSMKG